MGRRRVWNSRSHRKITREHLRNFRSIRISQRNLEKKKRK